MATRSNACTELTRFWLEARHAFLVSESTPVPVPYGQSDLDIVAIQSALKPTVLPPGQSIGPRLVVETKDEHDFDPRGREFGKMLRSDLALMGDEAFIPRGTLGRVKFSMLREAHYEVASRLFGSEEFDRLFIVHAIDPVVLSDVEPLLASRRIHWLTIPEIVHDLQAWYRIHPRPTGLRHSLFGDIWHLLVGYCGLDVSDRDRER